MIKKIFNFISEKWAVILTAVLGLLAYLKVKDELEARKQAEAAAEATRKAVEEAEKSERERILAAEKKLEEDKRKRDEEIKKEKEKSEEKLQKEIEKKIENDVQKSGEQQAKEFASAFGGAYVKKDN